MAYIFINRERKILTVMLMNCYTEKENLTKSIVLTTYTILEMHLVASYS